MIGTTVDKYEVLRKVGEGGMSTVYLGRHVALDRDVAIKVLHPHLSASSRNRKRFAREARAIEQLHHPNIVEIYDYSGDGPGESWIVTEFVEGETLGAVLERVGSMPSELVTALGVALSDALAYAHEQGILHRDLKPENVMVRRDGRIKLMDFGIARFLDESQVTMTGALVGSPAFMSPEQAQEEPLDARSDLFSLGTLLYLAVSGRLPFVGSNPSVVLRHIVENRRPALDEVAPDVSPALCDIIERLLAPLAADRPSDARQTAELLRSAHREVGFDPDQERWALTRFLREPEPFREELTAWLVPRLLAAARVRIDHADALTGLRIVNRLLSLHEGDADALALLDALHGAQPSDPRRSRRLAWAAAAVLAAVFLAVVAAGRWGVEAAVPESAGKAPSAGPVKVASRDLIELPAADPAPAPAAEDLPPVTRAPRAVPRPPTPLDATVRAVRMPAVLPAAPAAALAAAVPAPACVGFRTPDAPAEVYLEGVRIRSTREPGCAKVPSGHQVFTISGPMVREVSYPIDLAPGEVRDPIVVELERRPARVRFPEGYDNDCVVAVDGVTRGTLGGLRGAIELERPEVRHVVAVQCGSASREQVFERIDYPEILFEPWSAP